MSIQKMRIQKKNSLFFILLLSIYLLAWFVQDRLFLSWDVSSLLNMTKQFLNGGNYISDFFTPNSPMIFYLYSPVIFINKYLDIDTVIAFRSYIFILASCSFFMCYCLMRDIVKNDRFTVYAFLLLLLTLFLIFPFYELGQRDDLLFITSLPYLLLTVSRLERNKINDVYAVIIGLFAGLGFGIKPQFLIVPVLIEVYSIYITKNWRDVFRIENIAIFLLLVVYACCVLAFHADYVFVIIPYMFHHYYQNISLPWLQLLSSSTIFFCLFSLLVYVTQRKDIFYKTLTSILAIALLGFVFTYLSQRTNFIYHVLPALSTAILLLALVFIVFLKKYPHYFTLLLGVLFFTYPVYDAYQLYVFGYHYKKDVLTTLIAFMQKQPTHRSIYMISEEAHYHSPLIQYVQADNFQRFDCLWMLEELIKRGKTQGESSLKNYIQNNHDPYFFINIIADDLRIHHPDLVFVDVRTINKRLGGYYAHFNYLDNFLQNENFQKVWKHYLYFTTIVGGHGQYQLQVYKRI